MRDSRASTTRAGTPRAVAAPRTLTTGLAALLAGCVGSTAWAADVTINGSQRFQEMDGFGVSANVASWNGGELRPAIDQLVDQAGASIWRVVIDNTDWEAVNDDSNPQTFNWTYYDSVYTTPKLEELWSTLAYLNQKGIVTGVMLNFMGRVPDWMGGERIDTSAEDEWVEMIVSIVYYARNNRSLPLTLLAPMNEPGWDGIEGPLVDAAQFTRLMQKLAQRLDAVGLSDIRLVGPDTAASVGGFEPFFHELVGNPTVMAKLDHFALHDYGTGNVSQADNLIKSSAYPNKNFWITEVANIWDAFPFLGQGAAAYMVWEGYESVYNHAILAGRGTVPPNDLGNGPALLDYNTSTRLYTPVKAFYEHAQVFKYVTPGARRVAAVESDGNLQIYAFHHAVGDRITVVGRNTGGGSLTVNGTLTNLPTVSSFQFFRTNSTLNMQAGTNVPVTNGQFSVSIPGNTIFTLTALGSGAVTVPMPPTNLQVN